MTQILNVVEALARFSPRATGAEILALAHEIHSLYVFDARQWVEDHRDEFEGRRIACIKALRAAGTEFDGRIISLKEAKDIVVEAMPYFPTTVAATPVAQSETDKALADLREKLTAPPQEWEYGCGDPDCCPPYPISQEEDEDGSLAYARMLERRAEEGTYSDPYYNEPF